MRLYFTIVVFLFCITFLPAQEQNKAERFPYLYGTYSLQVPGGDMAKRFGISSDIGAGLGYKTKTNWLIGVEATFIFGNKLKEEPLTNILTESGQIIDQFGYFAPVAENERGLHFKASLGRIITVKGSNANSGILLRGAVGYLQHHINITNAENSTPQISGEYKYGYDRMCAGLSVNEFIGWQQFSEKRPIHFLIGFEFTQAFTKNMRKWDFETNSNLKENRLDLLYAFKIAWYIPIRQRMATQYFYY